MKQEPMIGDLSGADFSECGERIESILWDKYSKSINL